MKFPALANGFASNLIIWLRFNPFFIIFSIVSKYLLHSYSLLASNGVNTKLGNWKELLAENRVVQQTFCNLLFFFDSSSILSWIIFNIILAWMIFLQAKKSKRNHRQCLNEKKKSYSNHFTAITSSFHNLALKCRYCSLLNIEFDWLEKMNWW